MYLASSNDAIDFLHNTLIKLLFLQVKNVWGKECFEQNDTQILLSFLLLLFYFMCHWVVCFPVLLYFCFDDVSDGFIYLCAVLRE